jgi:hypothetical protein
VAQHQRLVRMEDVAGGGWLHPFVVLLSIVPPDGEAWGGGVAAAAVRRAGRQDIVGGARHRAIRCQNGQGQGVGSSSGPEARPSRGGTGSR